MRLKNLIIAICGLSPIANIFSKYSAKQPLVVLYHGVTANLNPSGSENYRHKHIPIASFYKQMKWLRQHFEILALERIEDLIFNKKIPSKPVCAITFDDGYKNNYVNAFPILKKLNIPATIFITTGFIDSRTPLWTDRLEHAVNRSQAGRITIKWPQKMRRTYLGEPDEDLSMYEVFEKNYSIKTTKEKIAVDIEIRERLKKLGDSERNRILDDIVSMTGVDLRLTLLDYPDYCPLSWEEIKEIASAGISIGAHTVNHQILAGLDEDSQKEEILFSVRRIRDEIGHCSHFAYPNGQKGDWDKKTEAILSSAGFKAAWTTEARRINISKENDLFTLPRITLDGSHLRNRFKAFVSNAALLIKGVLKK